MATRQEEYEMTRSHSAGSSRDYERQEEEEEEEEAQLLDKEDSSSSSDDEWTVIVDEDQQELPPVRTRKNAIKKVLNKYIG